MTRWVGFRVFAAFVGCQMQGEDFDHIHDETEEDLGVTSDALSSFAVT